MTLIKSALASTILALTACASEKPEVSRDPSRQPVAEPTANELVAQSSAGRCLAEAIYFEAGTHSEDGRAAVGHVVMNRVADGRFPNSVCAVIREGEAAGACQFSYRCSMDPALVRWPQKMAAARNTANAVLTGERADPTSGALFFHAASIPAGWFATRDRMGTFGGNVFYK